MSQKNFTIYKSSAGSGKTFTLVKEYLTLALSDERTPPRSYRHILAITFTNKAASEMKERIIKALEELARKDQTSISQGTKILLGELQKSPVLNAKKTLSAEDIRVRSQRVLSAILHNYSDFAIGTIDSFVYKIVRTFAFDLKIPMSFDLELDGDELIAQAIDLLMAEIGNDESLTKILVEFTEEKADDEKNWHIEKDLQKFAKNLLTEEGSIYIDKLKALTVDDFFGIKSSLSKALNTFDNKVKTIGNEALTLISNSGIDKSKFAGGEKGIYKYFSYLAEARKNKLVPTATVQKNIDGDKWYATKATTEDKQGIDGIKDRLLSLYNDVLAYVEEHIGEITLFRLINTNIYSLAVLNEIEKLLNDYKAQNNILHISEFNKMIAKIVLNEPIPFIYERLGEKYDNYLIDEFQDTSVLQFHNLLPLIDNSLSKGKFTMLVGDGKQAIYRWRGGEVEQFSKLPYVFAHNDNPLLLEREEALIRNHNPEKLDKNYRSKREVIEFNNSIFEVLSSQLNERYKVIYDGVKQEFREDHTGGHIQLDFLEGDKQEVIELNLARTYQIVEELLADNFNYKDIAVLVRKNTDGSQVANYLSMKGVPVISSESLLLSNSKEVAFLAALKVYLHNTDNQIVQTELLEYFIASQRIKGIDFDSLLLENRTIGFQAIVARVCPEFNPYILSKMALYELTEELIRLFKLNAEPNAYIQFYLDEVLNYSIRKNNNLGDFILHWEAKKMKASLVVPDGLNAVTIMTIHKSKGLEFPVVILPFSNGKLKNGKDNLWVNFENDKIPELQSALLPVNTSLESTDYAELYEDEKSKSLLDNLNVLYVALTRPEERMYILTGKPSKKPEGFGTLTDLFAFYLQKKQIWEDTQMTYILSEGKPRVREEAPSNSGNYMLNTFNSTQWRGSIKMRAAAASIWNLEDAERKRDYGILVHTALAHIKTDKQVQEAVNLLLSQGLIGDDETSALSETLTRIVMNEVLNPHFQEGLLVKNEAEIIRSDGKLLRPDRVVIDGKKAVVIDYKTGSEKSAHKKQIIGYGDLLAQMGYEVAEKIVVYIEANVVVKV